MKLHFGKIQILTISEGVRLGARVGEEVVTELSTEEAEKYLGRKVSLGELLKTELRHRSSSGWAAFESFKTELKVLRIQRPGKTFRSSGDSKGNVRNGNMDID